MPNGFESKFHPIPYLIPPKKLQERIIELAKEIETVYKGEPLTSIVVLKGAFIFAADLLRYLHLPDLKIDFLEISSYEGTNRKKEIIIERDTHLPLYGEHILVIEDIIDTGHTYHLIQHHLQGHEPKSISVCTLLNKPEAREVEVPITFSGFDIPNHFVVGYGLDYNERFRHLPGIAILDDVLSAIGRDEW